MGKSYKKSRHKDIKFENKKQRRQERRRIRTRNRKVKDDFYFEKFLNKSPFSRILENHSTVPNYFVEDDIVFFVECVIRQLGPDVGYRDIHTNMSIEQQLDLAITILTHALTLSKENTKNTKILHALKYIKDSKKQFQRRGTFDSFKGHDNNKLHTIGEDETKHEEVVPKVIRHHPPLVEKLRLEVQENHIPDPPPLPSHEDLYPKSNYTIKIAKPIKTKQPKHVETKEDNDESWACNIM